MNRISPMERNGTNSWQSQEQLSFLPAVVRPLINAAAVRVSDIFNGWEGTYTSLLVSLYSRFRTKPRGGFLRSTSSSVAGRRMPISFDISSRVALKETLAPCLSQPRGLGKVGNVSPSSRKAWRVLLCAGFFDGALKAERSVLEAHNAREIDTP